MAVVWLYHYKEDYILAITHVYLISISWDHGDIWKFSRLDHIDWLNPADNSDAKQNKPNRQTWIVGYTSNHEPMLLRNINFNLIMDEKMYL